MKRIVYIVIICLIFFECSWRLRTSQSITVNGSLEQWSSLMDNLELSKAPHDKVRESQKFLYEQIKSQIDSVKSK